MNGGGSPSTVVVAAVMATLMAILCMNHPSQAASAVATAVNVEEATCTTLGDDGTCVAPHTVTVPGGDGTRDDPILSSSSPKEEEEEDDNDNDDDSATCKDQHENCDVWAGQGECTANPNYMTLYCRRSCELCQGHKKVESSLTVSYTEVELSLGMDFGEPQLLENVALYIVKEASVQRIVESREYIKGLNMDKALLDLCKNKHESCSVWALAGECTKNPGYMKLQCGPACKSCDQLSIESRCPVDPDAIPAWQPGDLDAMFRRLVEEPFASAHDVTILSRDPWVVTLEGIVTDEEADRLIELGAKEGFARSADVGTKLPDGTYSSRVNSGRTSTNAWCQNECYKDPVALRVIDRLSNITGINETNSEYLQLLRYEPGQFYNTHHDYVIHNKDRQQGPRILTVFLYLNDVEAGGGTNFDTLNITVMPRRGRALLWPSVLDAMPREKDGRTTHQALPVEAGIKYAANAWFHLHDFKTPNKNGCSS